MKLKIGVRAHDVGHGTPEDLFETVKNEGINYVQLVFKKALEGHSYDVEYVERVKKALENNDIKVAMLGAYFNPVHSKRDVVESGINEFKNNLCIAHKLGIDIVGSETGSYNDSPWTYVPKNHTEEGFQESLGVFKELRDYALNVGACLSIEPAWNHVIYDIPTLKRFIDILNEKGNVFVTIDLFNLIYIGNHEKHREIFKEALATFKERVKIIHLKDYNIVDGKINQTTPGKGLFDYPFMIKTIKEYSPNAVLVFEGVVPPELSEGLKYITDLIK